MITFDKDEKVLFQAQPHPKLLVNWFFSKIVGFFIVLIFFLISFAPLLFNTKIRPSISALVYGFLGFFILLVVISFIYIIYLRKTYEYYITNQRVIFKGGLLFKTTRSVPFHKITDVEISQHILEQILGLYKLNIFTAGTGSFKAEIIFSGLTDAKVPEQVLKDILKKYKSTGE